MVEAGLNPYARHIMKRLMVLAVLIALSGCNTISGVGQDISGGANMVSGWMGG